MITSMFIKDNINSVIVGISGGADSVAMLLIYHNLKMKVYAAHCNFHLRGSESERDQEFVVRLCERLNIPLFIKEFDTKAFAESNHLSIEMACRELRYKWFRELKNQLNADRIAVAHNADDNVETLFLNLMRGSGIAGLRGMLPDTGELIRPLLNVSRADILKYLESKHQEYKIDSTNLNTDYRRNYIRHKILPALEEEWPEAKKSILRSMENLRLDEAALEEFTESIWGDRKNSLEYHRLSEFRNPKWLVFRFIKQFGGSYRQAEEICRTISCQEFQSGKYWEVDGGRIVAERNKLEFVEDGEPIINIKCYKIEDKGRKREASNASLHELWTIVPPDHITFRHVKNGDRIKPLGMKGSVLVSKILKDAKLSYLEKIGTIIAEEKETKEIIWVKGLKRSRKFLVSEDNNNIYLYK